MEILLTPIELLVGNPIVGFAVSLVFFILFFMGSYSKRSKWVLGGTGSVWLVYGLWEACLTHFPSENTWLSDRIDMIFVGPVLLVISLVGFFIAVLGFDHHDR